MADIWPRRNADRQACSLATAVGLENRIRVAGPTPGPAVNARKGDVDNLRRVRPGGQRHPERTAIVRQGLELPARPCGPLANQQIRMPDRRLGCGPSHCGDVALTIDPSRIFQQCRRSAGGEEG
jgi:hypothetical protein